MLEGARGDGFNGRERGYGGVRVNFVLLAEGTALDVAADVGGKAGPPEFGRDQLSCLQEARVAGGLVIMAALEDGTAEGVVRGDVDAAFVR